MMGARELAKEGLQNFLMRDCFIWRMPESEGCALTFDDGPHEIFTEKVLDLLARLGISATFFVVGDTALRAPGILRRIVREGHAIGSHTFSHREFPDLSQDEFANELTRARRTIKEAAGIDTDLVRPPRGRINARSLFLAKKMRYRIVHWSKTYSDYLQDGAAPLIERMRSRGLDSGDIALFHDTNLCTIEALEVMLPEWLSQGRHFTTIR